MSPTPSPSNAPLFAFAGGGTGGHLFPALAIAQALRDRRPDARIVFFATQRPIDRKVLGDTDCDVITQTLPAMSGKPWRWPGALRGFYEARRLCRAACAERRPDVVVGTGGLGSVPALREAHRAGIRTAILNPDVLPGRANRHLGRRVHAVFAQFGESSAWFPASANVVVIGCPVRSSFLRADAAVGQKRFGLDPHRKTLLVTGASQGARSVNQAIAANLPFLETLTDWQVLHLTGEPDLATVEQAYRGRAIPAVALPFTDHMADALGAADLVVCRAGASFLAEIMAVGRAAILMPYPHHRDQHQMANARCLSRSGAAWIVEDTADPAPNAPRLRSALEALIGDRGQREEMATAARRCGRIDAADRIAVWMLEPTGAHDDARVGETMEAVR